MEVLKNACLYAQIAMPPSTHCIVREIVYTQFTGKTLKNTEVLIREVYLQVEKSFL